MESKREFMTNILLYSRQDGGILHIKFQEDGKC